MPSYDPQFDHRRSIRLRHYDYRWPGSYFVTICSQARQCILSEIIDDEMLLNRDGQIARDTWTDVPDRFPDLFVAASVVMPNHTHAIITISSPQVVGAGSPRPIEAPAKSGANPPSERPSLGQVIAYYKWTSTKRINERHGTPGRRVWQRNYFEHVIRNQKAYQTIGEYIVASPARWREDSLNPDRGGRGTS